jgi:DNA-binding protein HU-beta
MEYFDRSDLIKAVADRTGLSLKISEEAVIAALDITIEQLADNAYVRYHDFGDFEIRTRKPRRYTGRSPKTGEPFDVQKGPRLSIDFDPAPKMKERVGDVQGLPVV